MDTPLLEEDSQITKTQRDRGMGRQRYRETEMLQDRDAGGQRYWERDMEIH
jgi:hypothetical protein